MKFDVINSTKELEKNLKLKGYRSELQDKVKEVVTHYWDVSCNDGFHRPTQEFSFQIDTGNHPLIYCKPPRYDPNESEVVL